MSTFNSLKKQNICLTNPQESFTSASSRIETYNLSSVKFHPSEKDILATSAGNDLSIFNLSKQNKESMEAYYFNAYTTYSDHFFNINCLAWNKDGKLLASGGNDAMINIYDLDSAKLCRNITLLESQSAVTCLDFNFSSSLLCCGIYDKQLHLYDLRMNKPAFKIIAHSEPVTSVSFSDDGLNFISTSYDGFLRVWDIYKGNCLKTISFEKSPALAKAEIQPDGIHCLVSSINGQIQLINLINEEEIIRFQGHSNKNYLLDYDILYKASEKDYLSEYNLTDYSFSKRSNSKYNFDEIYLISGSEDGLLYIWDFENSANTMTAETNKDTDITCIFSLSVNADCSLIAYGGECNKNIMRNNTMYLYGKTDNTVLGLYSFS